MTKLVAPTQQAAGNAVTEARPDHLLQEKANKIMLSFFTQSTAAPLHATDYSLGLRPGNKKSEKDYAKALEVPFGPNGRELNEVVQSLSPQEQQAVYQHSEVLRAFLGVEPMSGVQRVHPDEAPAALAVAATRMRNAKDAEKALELMDTALKALPSDPKSASRDLHDFAKLGMSRLAAEPHRLASDKVRERAKSIIESHIDKLDLDAQKYVKKAATTSWQYLTNQKQRDMASAIFSRPDKRRASDAGRHNADRARFESGITRTHQPPRSANTEPGLSPQETVRALKDSGIQTEFIAYLRSKIDSCLQQISSHLDDDNKCGEILKELNDRIHDDFRLRVRFSIEDVYDLSELLSAELRRTAPASQALPAGTPEQFWAALDKHLRDTNQGHIDNPALGEHINQYLRRYNAADDAGKDAVMTEFNQIFAHLGMTLTVQDLGVMSATLRATSVPPQRALPAGTPEQFWEALDKHLRDTSQGPIDNPALGEHINQYLRRYNAADDAGKDAVMKAFNQEFAYLGMTLTAQDLGVMSAILRAPSVPAQRALPAGTPEQFLTRLAEHRKQNGHAGIAIPGLRQYIGDHWNAYNTANDAGKDALMQEFNQKIAPLGMTLTVHDLRALFLALSKDDIETTD